LLQEAITHSAREVSELSKERLGALALNNILVEETVSLFEKSLWNWRDVVRDLEKVSSYFPPPFTPSSAENVLESTRHRRRTPRSRLHQVARNRPPHNPLLRNHNRGNRNSNFHAKMLFHPPQILPR
jgi:hypothetical protein